MKPDYSKKLSEFTEYLKTIPEIIGICYTGSTATASWDEYSDLDIDIVVKDKDYDKIVKKIPSMMKFFGKVKFCNQYETWEETYAFVGENYLKIEIEPIRISYFDKPHFDTKNIKIIYDKTGIMTKGKKISQNLKHIHLDKKYFRWALLDMRSNFFYVVNHYARGQKFEAVEQIEDIIKDIFKMLAKTKELEEWELRRIAERNMTKKEFNLWKKSKPKSLEKSEIERALKECWEFMKYVEGRYEEVSGQKLNLEINDKEIFNRLIEVLR